MTKVNGQILLKDQIDNYNSSLKRDWKADKAGYSLSEQASYGQALSKARQQVAFYYNSAIFSKNGQMYKKALDTAKAAEKKETCCYNTNITLYRGFKTDWNPDNYLFSDGDLNKQVIACFLMYNAYFEKKVSITCKLGKFTCEFKQGKFYPSYNIIHIFEDMYKDQEKLIEEINSREYNPI